MFGYVKPYIPELKVREHELYRALYCGLCRAMGNETGTLSRFTLSYDFAFLSAVRFLATGNVPVADKKTCMAHPLKKRTYIKDSEELRYCARVSALLTEGKVRDDLADESGIKKLRALLARPEASYMVRKAKKNCSDSENSLKDSINASLSRLSELEVSGCDSLDTLAEVFGDICGEFCSACLPERESRICREIGRGVGRFIYVTDALDDLRDDFKKHRFNPVLSLYGDSAVEVCGNEVYLSRAVAESVKTSMLLDLKRPAASAELLMDGGHPELCAIVRNIFYLGMPNTLQETIEKHTKKELQNTNH